MRDLPKLSVFDISIDLSNFLNKPNFSKCILKQVMSRQCSNKSNFCDWISWKKNLESRTLKNPKYLHREDIFNIVTVTHVVFGILCQFDGEFKF